MSRCDRRNADDVFAEFFGPSNPSGGGVPRTGGGDRRNADDVFAEFFEPSNPSGGGVPRTGGGDPRNADDVFVEFFGPSNPSGGGVPRTGGGDPRNADDVFTEFFESSNPSGRGARQGMGTNVRPQKAAPIENKLPFSLEELYKGATKKMKVSKEIADSRGKITTVEDILTVDIKPGWKKGTKITFLEKGNQRPNVIPSDLVSIIDEKPHSVFKRDGNDLIVTQKITLLEALTSCTVQLTTLDGRSLAIPINNTIQHDYEKVVSGEGMPLFKDPSKKGNLRIKFDMKLPTRLSAEQKAGLKRLLGQCAE